MNMIVYQTSTSRMKLAKDFWVFGAIAGPLTLLTLIAWLGAMWGEKKRKDKAQQLEEGKDIGDDETSS